jgi:hypothetical protein
MYNTSSTSIASCFFLSVILLTNMKMIACLQWYAATLQRLHIITVDGPTGFRLSLFARSNHLNMQQFIFGGQLLGRVWLLQE